MRQLIGFIVFSFLLLGPLNAAEKSKNGICSPGQKECCGACIDQNDSCPSPCSIARILILKKKEKTIYSLPAGAAFKCEDNRKIIPLSVGKDGTTIYTCEPTN